jgi:hypothetical protein
MNFVQRGVLGKKQFAVFNRKNLTMVNPNPDCFKPLTKLRAIGDNKSPVLSHHPQCRTARGGAFFSCLKGHLIKT